MSTQNKDIKFIKGVGEKRAELFKQLGVVDSDALFSLYPRNYEDWSSPKLVSEAPFDLPCCIKAKVVTPIEEKYIRRNMTIYKFIAEDEKGGTLYVSIFNNKFITKTIKEGNEYLFYGKADGNFLEKHMSAPIIRPVGYEKIRPIYKTVEGLTSANIEKIISDAIKGFDFPDYLPNDIKLKYNLCNLSDAINRVHFPKKKSDIEIARKRLAFDEMFFLQTALLYKKFKKKSDGISISKDYTEEFINSLPFALTNAQHNAINDCVKDISSGNIMNRLIQGDVGSGKTVVAAAIIYSVIKNGFQSALMVPTEILAEQHFETFKQFFEKFTDIKIGLLSGSTPKKEKEHIKLDLSNGDLDLVIGTHAIIQEDVSFKNLGLVITDEQHRFGVEQRTKLSSKSSTTHILVMSATPIPRTLSLIIYGDLDISIINELPSGRQPINTYCVTTDLRQRVFAYIKKVLDNGNQGYIVCPLVEEGENGLKSATEYFNSLSQNEFSNYKLALLHGKMKPSEKEKVMREFSEGKVQLLIATTVIEVGINVPNATIMVIENSERFGLSQLHQLRGRIGRGSKKSDCILIADVDNNDMIPKRLKIISSTQDGFKIADEDLKLRGPGDFLGKRQHGLPEMKIADISTDLTLIRAATDAAADFLKSDPSISAPQNKEIRKNVARILKNLMKYGYN